MKKVLSILQTVVCIACVVSCFITLGGMLLWIGIMVYSLLFSNIMDPILAVIPGKILLQILGSALVAWAITTIIVQQIRFNQIHRAIKDGQMTLGDLIVERSLWP